MAFINQKRYVLDPQILYNNCNTNNLHGAYIKPESLSQVGSYKKIPAGSFLGSNNRAIARSKVIAPYTAGSDSVVVQTPWLFLPGDVLYEIGDKTDNLYAEQQAVANQTQEFGTVTAVDSGSGKFKTTVTPNNIAAGDVFSLTFEEIEVKVIADSTDTADLIDKLKSAMSQYLRPDRTSLDTVNIEYSPTEISFTAVETGMLFTVTTAVGGTGSLDVTVEPGAGTLSISPAAGNNNQSIGAKIGVVGDRALGVIAHTYYLNNDWGQDLVADFAAYDMANVYKKALPYLDGDLIAQLPKLEFI